MHFPGTPTTASLLILTAAVTALDLGAQANWRLASPMTSPAARTDHALSVTGSEGMLYGGQSGASYLSDTWEYSASGWQRLAPAQSPGPLAHASACWDSSRGIHQLFGGRAGGPSGAQVNDTWEWQSGNWVKLATANAPAAREGAAMYYDNLNRRTVLFGGNAGGTLRNDTWVLASGAWTMLNSTQAPSPRVDHAMAFDRSRSVGLLFGGRDSGPLGDTWLFNGSQWQQLLPSQSPPAGYGGALAFDLTRDRFVLFGGTDGITKSDATWEFDGTDWIMRQPSRRPSPRCGATLNYLFQSGVSLAFGGEQAGMTASGETWIYDNVHTASTRSFGAGCAHAAGTPSLLGSRPWQGEAMELTMLGLPVSSPNVLQLGLSDAQWNGVALPLDLGLLGAPGCQLWVEPRFGFPVANPTGNQTLNLTVPVSSQSLGATIYAQVWAQVPANNALGVTVSNGVALTVGRK